MGHVWSKTRSLGQILEKPCVRSGGHIFSPITMKLCQNVGLAEISDSFENESCRAKIQVNRSNFGKTCVRFRGHIFSPTIMKLCLDKFLDEFENGSCRVKNKSTGSYRRKILCML